MEEFALDKFKQFVEKQIIKLHKKPTSLTKEEVLNSICQFEVSPAEAINRTAYSYSRCIKDIFDITNKPKRVALNTWLLYLFGFRKCSTCKQILSLTNYYNDRSNWSKLADGCKYCLNKYNEQYRENNKEWRSAYDFKYRQENKHKTTMWEANRRAKKKAATPNLTNEEKQQIEQLYLLRDKLTKENRIEYHVDHIIPLCQGGQHHPNNLQVITAKENLTKPKKKGL